MIRSDRSWASALFALVLVASTPALAHHSFAPYEPDIQVQFKGIVTKYQWTNPHVYIEMDVRSADGETQALAHRGRQPGDTESHRLEVEHDQGGRRDQRHRVAAS